MDSLAMTHLETELAMKQNCFLRVGAVVSVPAASDRWLPFEMRDAIYRLVASAASLLRMFIFHLQTCFMLCDIPYTHTGLANAISSSNPCAPKLNFFPTAMEIDADVQQYVLLANGSYAPENCTENAVCNFPAVWTRQAQAAAAAIAGVTVADGVLKVALKEYGEGECDLMQTPNAF
jgi:hypothetical protein